MTGVVELLKAVLGEAEVLTGTDISDRYRGDWQVKPDPSVLPLALVRPRNTAEVSDVLRLCNDTSTPVVPQGGLTGLVGGGAAIDGAVLLSLERMRTIEELDPVAGTMTVEAGVPLQTVQDHADRADLFFPLDIGSRGSCLIGGNASTNAGGNRVLRYGMMRDLVLGLEAVMADGTVVTSLNKMLKNNVGYDLKQLFIGSEGTLGVITRLVLRLFPKPRSTATALCGSQDLDAVCAFLGRARSGLAGTLSSFELMWPNFFHAALKHGAHRDPFVGKYGVYVLIEMTGTDPDLDPGHFENVIGEAIEAGELKDAVIAQSMADADRLWAIRDMSGELSQRLAPLVSFDISIEIGNVGPYLDDCQRRCRAVWPTVTLYNFGHLADSNIHIIATVDDDPFPAHEIEEVIYGCTRDWQGSISAEVGIGLTKKEYLACSRSVSEIALMKMLKATMDPRNILNPGKVFDSALQYHGGGVKPWPAE